MHTGDLEYDEVHYPDTIYFHDSLKLLAGWISYNYFGKGRRDKIPLMNLKNPLFKDEIGKCVVSYAALGCVLFYIFTSTCAEFIMLYYLPSLLVTYGWIGLITIMHHDDESIIWKKNPKEINGAIESIDRHYGYLHNLIHNLGTHQVHHICPQIPFYNLPKQHEFRKHFPELCKISDAGVIKEFIRLSNEKWKNRFKFDENKVYDKFNYYDSNLIKIHTGTGMPKKKNYIFPIINLFKNSFSNDQTVPNILD